MGERRYPSREEIQRLERILLDNIHTHAPALRKTLDEINSRSCYENGIYRFYHQSFKTFEILQVATDKALALLAAISPDGRPFCEFFNQIIAAGTQRTFSLEDNANWVQRTAPIVEAFFHARYFLEMAVKYAEDLKVPPQQLPFGWAALLELYGIR